SQTLSLSKPIDFGVYSARLFSEARKVNFSLTTSWIPGENHKGMLRYKINVAPQPTEPPDPVLASDEDTATLMKRVHSCSIFVNLYDQDGFVLRRIHVIFDQGVDENVKLRSLYANEAVQMDAQEYRTFIGKADGTEAGSWNMSWNCGSP